MRGCFIDGKAVPAASGASSALISPATGAPVAEVAAGGAADIRAAVDAAQRAFAPRSPWRLLSTRERGRMLRAIAESVRAHSEDLAQLESASAGKPIRDARDEMALAADCFDFYAGAVDKAGGAIVPVAAAGTCLTFREPIGVCGMIVPWNFPLAIASWKVAPALAMGNTLVLKPASQTPLTALRLAELAVEAGLPAGVLNVVPGRGGAAGEALVRDPRVRKVSFTGSTEVGSRVMALAAENITRVTLELGGKSAAIVFADADLARAIPAAVTSALGNAGQDCCARSRVLVERRIYDSFVADLAGAFERVRVGNPADEATEMGPLVSATHRERVRGYIAAGTEEGAQLVCGGDVPTQPGLADGWYLTPALFADATPAMTIAREEIFGPVVCCIPFDTEEEAVAIANDSRYGLSGSIWTRDLGRALRLARAVETGVLSINSGHSVHLEAPFGGVKQSGLGRELGLAALDHYSEWKTVFIDTRA